MRILRSQYLKQQAKHQLQVSTISTSPARSGKIATSINTRSREIATKRVTSNGGTTYTQRSEVHYAVSIPPKAKCIESPINVTLTLGENDNSHDITKMLLSGNHLCETQRKRCNTSMKSVASASLNIVSQRQYSVLIPREQKRTSSPFCYTLPRSDCVEGNADVTPLINSSRRHMTAENELRINIENADPHRFSKINVVVQVYSVDAKWFTRFYNIHKEKFWMKIPRNGSTKATKWYFKCRVCERQLCSFSTLKSHLNRHVGFIPYRCKNCGKGYSGANSFYKHNRTKHMNQVCEYRKGVK